MSRLSSYHQELRNGIGRCSVPMWIGGCPGGFCDEPAYGKQEKVQKRYGEWSQSWGKWFDGYCSGLACYAHGGPETPPSIVVKKDGNAWCAHRNDFINLQESLAEFGDTKAEAIERFLAAERNAEEEKEQIAKDNGQFGAGA